LRNGVKLQEAGGFNPFKFGLIGSSDMHDAAAPRESDKYFGHSGRRDTSPVCGPMRTHAKPSLTR
jgi:hypothetical protein